MLRRRARHGNPDRAALAAVLAIATVAGCGGGDQPETFPAGVARPIAKVEFLAEADRICASTNARVEAAADGLVATGEQPPAGEVRRIVTRVVVPALEAEVRAIEALGAPASDRGQVEAIVAATERGIAQIEADPVAVLDGPPPALREAGRLARAYGSRECGVPAG